MMSVIFEVGGVLLSWYFKNQFNTKQLNFLGLNNLLNEHYCIIKIFSICLRIFVKGMSLKCCYNNRYLVTRLINKSAIRTYVWVSWGFSKCFVVLWNLTNSVICHDFYVFTKYQILVEIWNSQVFKYCYL